MNQVRLKIFLALLGILIIVPTGRLWAQQGPQFYGRASQAQVAVGQSFEISFVLENGAQGEQFRPPALLDFELYHGPYRSFSSTIINGKGSTEERWTYTLIANKPGKFLVKEALVESNGKTLRSTPFYIQVVNSLRSPDKGNPNTVRDQGREIFIAWNVDRQKAYAGQQILADLKIYTRKPVNQVALIEMANMNGFYQKELQQYDAAVKQEKVNGRTYNTKILRRVALFPLRSGKLNLGSETYHISVADENDPMAQLGFPSMSSSGLVVAKSDPVALDIQALPTPTPADFCGVVGHLEAEAILSHTSVSNRDAPTLTLTLTGDGDPQRIDAPQLEYDKNLLQLLPARRISENAVETTAGLQATKVLEYGIQPLATGKTILVPSVSWFNPESGNYEQWKSKPLALEILEVPVKKSTGTRFTDTEDSAMPDAWYRSTAFITTASISLFALLLLGFLWWRRSHVQAHAAPVHPPVPAAHTHWEHAQLLLQQGDVKGFYTAVENLLNEALCNYFTIPLADLDDYKLRELLLHSTLPVHVQNDVQEVRKIARQALFAGINQEHRAFDILDKTKKLIPHLERNIN